MDFAQIIEFEVAQISAMDILTFLLAGISLCLAVRRYRISFDNNIINYVNAITSLFINADKIENKEDKQAILELIKDHKIFKGYEDSKAVKRIETLYTPKQNS